MTPQSGIVIQRYQLDGRYRYVVKFDDGREGVFFASTKVALEVLERYLDMKLRKRELGEGRLLALEDGAIVRKERFRPDLEYIEHDPLPSVRAPHERDVCLTRLKALAA